jgi:hypothetical protein
MRLLPSATHPIACLVIQLDVADGSIEVGPS